MRKSMSRIAVALLACVLVVACGQDKKLAEAAIKTAEDAVNAVPADVQKYAADSYKAVTELLAGAKDAFARKDYKAALASANQIGDKIKEATAAAMAKKDELTKAWTDLSAGLPGMVDAIKSRVDVLSAAKKLPAGMDKAKLDDAKAGLAAATQSWSEASDAFKAGNLTDALAKANSVKEKAVAIMQTLGMSVPPAASAPAAK